MGRGLTKYNEHQEAAITYLAAAKIAKSDTEQLNLLGYAAVAFAKATAKEELANTLNQMKQQVQRMASGESELLNTIKNVAEITKEDTLYLAAMERLIDLDPSDSKARFSLAYKHSMMDNDELALFHYSRIPADERDPITWNNLGVSLDHFDLSATSVQAYKKSEELGETLATSNLAKKLIAAGFLDEAKERCEVALKVQDYHTNILHYMTEIKEKPEQESKKEKEILDKTKALSDYFAELGKALAAIEPETMASQWLGGTEDSVLNVTQNGSKFKAIGTYEINPSPLANAFLGLSGGGLGLMGSTTKLPPPRYVIEYEGTLRGRTIEGTVSRQTEGERARRTLLSGDIDPTVLMILSEDGKEIRVMERKSGVTPRFYKLTSISDS